MILTIKKGRAFVWAPILALAATVILFGCTPPGPRALLRGEKLIEKEKYQQAVRKLKKATSRLEDNAKAWNYLGLAYHGVGETKKALSSYRQALELNPDLAVVHFNRGNLHLENGQPKNAVEEFLRFTKREPKVTDGWTKLAKAQRRVDNPQGARESYRQALELDPGNAQALNGLGLLELEQGNPKKALDQFIKTVQKNPNYAPARLNLAIVAQRHFGYLEYARARYKEYLKLKPDATGVKARINQIDAQLADKKAAASKPSSTGAAGTNKVKKATVSQTNGVLVADGSSESDKGATLPISRAQTETQTSPSSQSGSQTNADPARATKTNAVATTSQTSSPSGSITNQTTGSTPTKTNTTPSKATGETVENESSSGDQANESSSEKATTDSKPAEATAGSQSEKRSEKESAAKQQPQQQDSAETTPSDTEQSSDSEAKSDSEGVEADDSEETDSGDTETSTEGGVDRQDSRQGSEGTDDDTTSGEGDTSESGLADGEQEASSGAGTGTPSLRNRVSEEVTPLDPTPTWLLTQRRRQRSLEGNESAISGTSDAGDQPKTESQRREEQIARQTAAAAFPRYAYQSPATPEPGNRAKARSSFQAGLSAHQQGNHSQAKQSYRAAIAADPAYFKAHYNFGLASMQMNDLTEALRAYETALALRPDSVKARYNFGLALQTAGYPKDAVKQFQQVLEQSPDHVRTHLALGKLYAETLRQPEKARKHYQRVLDLAPNHPDATTIRFWLARHP